MSPRQRAGRYAQGGSLFQWPSKPAFTHKACWFPKHRASLSATGPQSPEESPELSRLCHPWLALPWGTEDTQAFESERPVRGPAGRQLDTGPGTPAALLRG
ncbi:hypothetical protein CapIbe_008683 [Capra ibex]